MMSKDYLDAQVFKSIFDKDFWTGLDTKKQIIAGIGIMTALGGVAYWLSSSYQAKPVKIKTMEELLGVTAEIPKKPRKSS